MNIFTKSIFLTSSAFWYCANSDSSLFFTFNYAKITVCCRLCFEGDMLMFAGGIVIFLLGLLLYSTNDDNKFMFCFRIGCGVMFFSNNSRDSRISSLLPFFYDSFTCRVSSLSLRFVRMLNYF
jgi:hypothetical protein